MDVSVIMVNYKTAKLAIAAIKSVVEMTSGVDYEIVVVDNDSQDNSLADITSACPSVIAVDGQDNLGFGRANNLGRKYACGKYLFLLNTDTLLINNTIKTLFDYMEEHSDVGISGGNLYNADNAPMHSFGYEMPSVKTAIRYSLLPRKLSARHVKESLIMGFNDTGSTMEVGYITGADLMIRAEIFDNIGGFDSDFFMYCEESEMTNRVRKAGYKVVSVPNAKIQHLEGGSFGSDKFSPKRCKMMLESQYLYFQKVYGKSAARNYYYVVNLAYFLRRKKVNEHYAERRRILKETYKEWKNENR